MSTEFSSPPCGFLVEPASLAGSALSSTTTAAAPQRTPAARPSASCVDAVGERPDVRWNQRRRLISQNTVLMVRLRSEFLRDANATFASQSNVEARAWRSTRKRGNRSREKRLRSSVTGRRHRSVRCAVANGSWAYRRRPVGIKSTSMPLIEYVRRHRELMNYLPLISHLERFLRGDVRSME